MRKVLCILFTALLLIGALAVVSSAAPAEYKVGDTITFEKTKQIYHKDGGTYPVLESTYGYEEIEFVKTKNTCARVEETYSGYVVTFIEPGTARIEIRFHERESYSKYNTEEQKVYSHYNKNEASKTVVREYTVLHSENVYAPPEAYVVVHKDGYQYIDFATQEAIDTYFGSSSLTRHANLTDFFGFSYTFENNTFNVTLDNFTGEGLYFHCSKKDTNVLVNLKGTSSLSGMQAGVGKQVVFSAIAATGSKSVIWISAAESGGTLNVNMEALKNKNDTDVISRYVPFFSYGGTLITRIVQNTPATVNVTLTTEAGVVGSRGVNFVNGDLDIRDSNVNFTYNTDGYLKNYSGVTGKCILYGDTIFSGTLNNTRTNNTTAEYLLPNVTYANDFNGGAYFECTGGGLVSNSSSEVFIPNTLYKYSAAGNGVQYHAVTAANNALLTKVDPSYIGAAFPSIRVGQALPRYFFGLGFHAGVTWTTTDNVAADYAEKGDTYIARASFVPMKGCYINLRDLSASELAKAKSADVYSVANERITNTTTTRYDVLLFTLHSIQPGSPSFSDQPKSVVADAGDTVILNAPASNVNPAPNGYEWYSISNVKVFGVTIPWPTKLSDNAVYSGTTTSSLRVNVNENIFKIRHFYCKINGTGWESVRSDNATISKAAHIYKIALSVNDPVPGYSAASVASASGRDYDHYYLNTIYGKYQPSRLATNMGAYHESQSPAVKLDYTFSESTTDGCFWYAGTSSFTSTPTPMTASDYFQAGHSYTYRFRLLAKSGYKFADDVDITHEKENADVYISMLKKSDTEYLVDFTYKDLKVTLPMPGKQPTFLGVPVLYEGAEFEASASLSSASGEGYMLVAQNGWLDSAGENAKPVVPKLNGTYYLHYTLQAKSGYVFSDSGYTPTCYNAEDGKSLSYDTTKSKYIVSDESGTTLEVYLAFKCTQQRAKNLTLKGLAVPSVGGKLGNTASVDPALVNVTKIKYLDMGFNELQDTYVPKAKDMLIVSVYVKAKNGVSFAPNAVMTWTVTGNKLSAKAYKTAGMADNERCFDFNVSVHEHEWTNAENVAFLKEAATCLHGTIYYQSCLFCEAQGSETFEMNDKMPHAMAEISAKAATCTADGNVKYYHCGTCMKQYKDAAGTTEISASEIAVKATGHSWGAWTKLDDTQHQRVCANDNTHTEKANHTWDGGTVTKVATTTETGVRTYKCAVCGGTKTETIAKIPADHTHNYATLRHNTTDHWYECTCGAVKDKAAHTWDAGTVTKPATETAEGEKTFKCSVCGETKKEVIPKIGADYMLGDVDNNTKIEAADARLALRIAVGLQPTMVPGTKEYKAANVDKVSAGKVEAADARLILRKAVSINDAEWGKN